MEILEKINAELDAFKAKRTDLTKQLQLDFPKLFTPLFEKSKSINSFGWEQYTPYFNDGDECVFGVHHGDLDINGVDKYDDEAAEKRAFVEKKIWNGKDWVENKQYDQQEGEVLEEIKKTLASIPDEFYKDLFGDHKKITVHRDGSIETEEYEHD